VAEETEKMIPWKIGTEDDVHFFKMFARRLVYVFVIKLLKKSGYVMQKSGTSELDELVKNSQVHGRFNERLATL